MPRMMRRAAVLGATAHVASKRGQAKAQAQQEAAAAATPAPAAQPVAAVPPPVADVARRRIVDRPVRRPDEAQAAPRRRCIDAGRVRRREAEGARRMNAGQSDSRVRAVVLGEDRSEA